MFHTLETGAPQSFQTISLYILLYKLLVGLPSFAWDFYCQLYLYASLSLGLPSVSPKPNLTLNMTASLSHPPPPLLFPDKKFPVEAHFWLDKLFYYID